ncbi:hypothetical protein V5O48_019707, partial [Marasmius crinis-equi]
MAGKKAGGSSRLLDALDNWATPGSQKLDAPSTPPGNASGYSNGITPELLSQARAEQLKQQMGLGVSPDGELSLLLPKTPSLGSKSNAIPNASGFRLNYDVETP